jgi:hypothetical protein
VVKVSPSEAGATMPKLDRTAMRLAWSESPQLYPPEPVGGKHNFPAVGFTSVAVLPGPAGQVLELEGTGAELADPREERHI